MNDIFETLLVAILFLLVGYSSLWISFMFTSLAEFQNIVHDKDSPPELDHDHTLTITRCLGACAFVLLAMVFPQLFTWIASWEKPLEDTITPTEKLPEDSTRTPIRTPPEDASTEMLLRITELLTKLEERSAALAIPAASSPELPPMPPPIPRPPPVPPNIQTTADLEPVSTVTPTIDGMDAISMAQT